MNKQQQEIQQIAPYINERFLKKNTICDEQWLKAIIKSVSQYKATYGKFNYTSLADFLKFESAIKKASNSASFYKAVSIIPGVRLAPKRSCILNEESSAQWGYLTMSLYHAVYISVPSSKHLSFEEWLSISFPQNFIGKEH